jgi:aspartyl-tRNA(Asn)/glutamyl-tRNA(Gln) amidotransferase subunit C
MISDEDVKKLARLARLEISEDDATALSKDLNSILDHIKQLEKIDVSQVEPMSHVHGIANVFREDTIYQPVAPEKILSQAPDRFENFIRVPLIIEQGE